MVGEEEHVLTCAQNITSVEGNSITVDENDN